MGGWGARAADLPPPETPPPGTPSFLANVYIHLGPAAIVNNAGARIYTPAGRLPNATIAMPPNVTPSAEIGYRFTPNWAVSTTVGLPPEADVEGAGSLTPLGKLGSNVYGPVAVTGHYHFTTFGSFQPYVGAGPAYLIGFNSRDGALSDFQVQSAWGAVGQVGADYMLSDHFGLFVDLKQAYLRTTARGSLGPVPTHADVKLDPFIASGGLTYRF